MTAPFQHYTPADPMAPPPQLRLSELVGMLSHALDLTAGQPEGHCIRTCWIGSQLGQSLGLTPTEQSDLYFTLLLKDLGCSSNAARICQLYLTDDIQFKHDFKTIDSNLSAVLRFVLAQTGPDAGLSERIRALLFSAKHINEIKTELFETRCHRGAEIAASMRFSPGVQAGILALDEYWDGTGQPEGRSGRDIPRQANIALLAQVVDVHHSAQGRAAAIAEVRRRSGRWFDPELVTAFDTIAEGPALWDGLTDPALADRVFDMPPARSAATVDEGWLNDIASAFADVIDAKSPFTADHSRRVALYADMIAEELGLEAAHRRWLRRAALLHDLGKLAISNQILDKPGKLDAEEWQAIRQHSWHSERILERIPAFHDIAPVAGAHHERPDGKGYPYGLDGDALGLEVRILTAADVFDALSAERPYRAALPIDQVFAIMDRDGPAVFDLDCLAALKSGIARLQSAA